MAEMDDFQLEALSEREYEVLRGLADGLSNRELADQLYLAPSTVKWYIRQLNQKLYTENRHEIVEKATELGLFDDTQPEPTTKKHNVPYQTTPFIGRDAELDELAEILNRKDVRCVTVLAPGGMGKTRLALEATEQQLGNFPDGAYFVPLQPISNPENIFSQIATSVHFPFSADDRTQKQQVLDFLSNKRMLLLLDNYEHLLDGVLLVSEVLQSAPDVKIIVTSREKLALRDETIYTLQGMKFPSWETPEDALNYDAVQLLVTTAQRVKPDWELSNDNLDYVARVCRLTQGMPLGILLAVSWLDVYELERICEEIQSNLDFLETELRDIPKRQQSIRAIFTATWQRLKTIEQQVFMKMSVFRGGCTPRAIESVTGANPRILQGLVNKALLIRNREGRYDIHELLRQYAEIELSQSGELEAVRDAHAQYYAQAVHDLEGDLQGGDQSVEALDKFEVDFENVQATWKWAVQQQDAPTLNLMLESFKWFTLYRSREEDAKKLYTQAFEGFPDTIKEDHPLFWCRLYNRGEHHLFPEINQDRLQTHEQVLKTARQIGDESEIILALENLGSITDRLGDPKQALELCNEALQIARESNHLQLEGFVLINMAYLTGGRLHQPEAVARSFLLEALTIFEKIGTYFGLASIYNNLGVHEMATNGNKAEEYLHKSLAITRKVGAIYGTLFYLDNLVLVSLIQQKFELAHNYAQEHYDLAQYSGNHHQIAGSIGIFAQIQIYQRNFAEGKNLAEEAISYLNPSDPKVFFAYLMSLKGQALCALQQYTEAQAQVYPALKLHTVGSQVSHLFESLIGIAYVQGFHEQNYEKALEITSLLTDDKFLGMANAHPLFQDLIAYLKDKIPTVEYDAIWERGKSLNPFEVAQQLLNEYEKTNPE